MNENDAEPVAAEPAEAAPRGGESTLTFGPAAEPEDTSEGAAQLAPARDKGLSFLQPGTRPGSLGRLGHYEVLELLGKGGFGIVLKALDEKLERPVAIKLLGPQLARNAAARTRFVREARAGAAINSKHVVATYAVEESPVPYLVMEYIKGETLQDRLDRGGAFAARDVLRLGAEIAAGLAAAHEQGLIHRDIKPANILLEAGSHPHVKIADFGLARAVDDATLTQSGVIAGTPKFMSPEQARGEALDHRSDLFSLGSVLYAMCTGRPPFRAPKTLAVLKRVCDDDPQPIREVNAGVPEALVAVVNRLLVKDPAGRFPTAAAVAELLEQHLARFDDPAGAEATDFSFATPSTRSKATPPRPRAKRRMWAVAAGLLLSVLAFAVMELSGVTRAFRGEPRPAVDPNRPDEPPSVAQQTPAPVTPPAMPETPPTPEPAKPKEPVADPVVEQNPFRSAKVGDWADYKWTARGPEGTPNLTGTLKMEVIAKTDRTARVREVLVVFGRAISTSERDIDLGKPYDPANLPKEANVRAKASGGRETIRFGGKDYDASWTLTKLEGKVEGGAGEVSVKCWTAPDAPFGGVLKTEQTGFPIADPKRTQSRTLELAGAGHKLPPNEARAAAARGDWPAAAAAYTRLFAARPFDDGELAFEHAAVLLLAGDDAGYRKVCAEMVQRSGEWDVRPYHVARACTLAPDAGQATALAGKKAERELQSNGDEFWSLTEQGALAFRAGRDDAAAALFRRSLDADDRSGRAVLNWLWLALAEQRRGDPAKARGWLGKAAKWLDQHPPGNSIVQDDAAGLHLHNWLEAQVLYREAERALKPEVAPPPREVR